MSWREISVTSVALSKASSQTTPVSGSLEPLRERWEKNRVFANVCRVLDLVLIRTFSHKRYHATSVFDANIRCYLHCFLILIDRVACESLQMVKAEKRRKKTGSCTRTGLSKRTLWYLAHPGILYICFVAGSRGFEMVHSTTEVWPRWISNFPSPQEVGGLVV